MNERIKEILRQYVIVVGYGERWPVESIIRQVYMDMSVRDYELIDVARGIAQAIDYYLAQNGENAGE